MLYLISIDSPVSPLQSQVAAVAWVDDAKAKEAFTEYVRALQAGDPTATVPSTVYVLVPYTTNPSYGVYVPTYVTSNANVSTAVLNGHPDGGGPFTEYTSVTVTPDFLP